MNNQELLKRILAKPDSYIKHDDLLRNDKQWEQFLSLVVKNKLHGYLYYLFTCPNFIPSISENIRNQLIFFYSQYVIRKQNYNKVKKLLLKKCRKENIPIFILKDFDDLLFQKYDLDIFGKYSDLKKFKSIIKHMDYDAKSRQQGWPKRPIPQFKFSSLNNKLFPQIEFRYQAITIYLTKKNILDRKSLAKLTQEFWQNAKGVKNNFTRLPREYLFLILCLIYYIEDQCKGLNNLYRIWWFLKREKDSLNWKKIYNIAKKYHVTNVLDFILRLVEREFSPTRSGFVRNPTSVNIALRLIDLDYICRGYLSSNKIKFWKWKDIYIQFLTRGLLVEEPFWQKFLFFIHPKRFLFLVLGLLKVI